MDLRFTPADEAFRKDIRAWLEAHLSGRFAHLRGRGGPGDEEETFDGRREWEGFLAEEGWACVGWPEAHGGRGLPLVQELIFNEEYTRARGPGRLGHIGQTLLGPTLIHRGTPEQQARFLPAIRTCEALWCQGYSEPNAGSDLANVQTKAVLDGDEWVITGQKTWTSHAAWCDWAFVLCRTDSEAPKHRGISYLLVPMKQPGVDVRPIVQMSRTEEFNEVFFEEARTHRSNVVGEVNGGWSVAMATLAFERGASTLGQQLGFQAELEEIIAIAKRNGKAKDPVIRRRIAKAWAGLRVQRLNALRVLTNDDSLGREAMILKLHWSSWHKDLGELAMDVIGDDAEFAEAGEPGHAMLQTMFLFSRSDTIYAGSSQIQRNIIGERALGLPRGPR